MIWKNVEIEGFEGRYRVSDTGLIYSTYADKVMALILKGNGYYQTRLRNKGKELWVSNHRLVATTFIPNPDDKAQVNHINGNKLKNDVYNLEWCTPKENADHAYSLGLRVPHYKNVGMKFGKTSKYHYVIRKTCKRKGKADEHYYLAEVKATINKQIFKRSKQFSIKKFGELEAEQLAAEAVNTIVNSHTEFNGYALNVVS